MRAMWNKEKSIGKVLFIVEGNHTEPYILKKLFCGLLDYQVETIRRPNSYSIFNAKHNPSSRVFVINTKQSNIKYIKKDNDYLNNLFVELIETYGFDVDHSAIYYLFDRDVRSNTDTVFIRDLLSELKNSRENEGYLRQGLLLLSYPSVESFTLSNFDHDCFNVCYETGKELKRHLNYLKINQGRITTETLCLATERMIQSLKEIGIVFNIDSLGDDNRTVFDYEEGYYKNNKKFKSLSLLAAALIDLGVIVVS